MGRPEVLEQRPELAEVWARADAAFPVRITRSWWERMDPSDPGDPLGRQVLPDPAELRPHPEDLADPVGDAARSPLPWVVHKYPDRVLLLLTKRCHLYCRYCFRRTHRPSEREDPTEAELRAALDYVRAQAPSELILSGGDPLAVRDERLFAVIEAVRGVVGAVRIHTRAPVSRPDRVRPGLVEGLAARGPVWVVIHCNHPAELSPEVDAALARLVDAGIPVLNQSVLLRGVNDRVEVLAELCEALVRRRVFPYYLHHPDRVGGNAHFRLSTDEGLALWSALRDRISGVALPRYVLDPPDGTGKVDVGGPPRGSRST